MGNINNSPQFDFVQEQKDHQFDGPLDNENSSNSIEEEPEQFTESKEDEYFEVTDDEG